MPTIMRNGVPTQISVQEYNEALAKYRIQVLGIDESTGKLRHIEVKDLDKIWINGQEFSGIGYQGLLNVNTKSYVEEPDRANDGSMPNINDHDTFVVPRCKVNFKYFNIYDYQRLCNATLSNEFVVKYWDKQFGEFVMHKMYCEPDEMPKLYNVGTYVFGVLDYEVSFIGTRNDLQEFTFTYNANGGVIVGNPQLYNDTKTYKKGDKVYLEDERYFEAIYYVDTFKGQPLPTQSNEYWQKCNTYKYVENSSYQQGDIVYQQLDNNRRYYLCLQTNTNRPLTDTLYWELINVKKYSSTITYTKGQYVIDSSGDNVYQAIYEVDTFEGKDPTNTTYWRQIALGTGIKIKWGNSLVVANAEDLFDAPTDKHFVKWTTNADGTGYTYYPTQSMNVFRDMTLYAQWE